VGDGRGYNVVPFLVNPDLDGETVPDQLSRVLLRRVSCGTGRGRNQRGRLRDPFLTIDAVGVKLAPQAGQSCGELVRWSLGQRGEVGDARAFQSCCRLGADTAHGLEIGSIVDRHGGPPSPRASDGLS
jgi:hypothetical protein